MSGVTVRSGPHRAIKTEFRGPTDHHDSRIIATVLGSGKRFTFEWIDQLDPSTNFDQAAIQACEAMGWKGELVGASVNGGGYIYVLSGGHRGS